MIILTVPHSKCFNLNIRTCDTVAEQFANILLQQIKNLGNDVVIIKSNNNRYILDDNRFATKLKTIKTDSYLWNKLRETIKEYFKIKKKYDDIIVVDIHSFPNNTESFDSNDVVLLDNFPYQQIVKDLKDELIKKEIVVDILPAGTGQNAILDVLTLHPLYIPTILTEINEKYINSPNKLLSIAKIISEFLVKIKNKTKNETKNETKTNNYSKYDHSKHKIYKFYE